MDFPSRATVAKSPTFTSPERVEAREEREEKNKTKVDTVETRQIQLRRAIASAG